MHTVWLIFSIIALGGYYANAKAFPSVKLGQCGTVKNRRGRIINGNVAQVAQLPWMASIKHFTTHQCGGSIISSKFILSAAHCFEDELDYQRRASKSKSARLHGGFIHEYTVTLGEHSQLVEEEHSVNFTIKRMYFRDDYQKIPLINDIVLIELNEEIKWTDFIQPICLPSEDIVASEKAMAAGWGRDLDPDVTHEDNKKLRFIELKIYENEVCNGIYEERGLRDRIIKSQMCAGSVQEYKDTNQGDSGGPLQINIGDKEVLVGITSVGTLESIPPKAPGIYTRVFEYMEWIAENMRNS